MRQAGVKVQTDKIADGVWCPTGGTHHMRWRWPTICADRRPQDYPLRRLIAEVKKTVPDKPIKPVVNTHHHLTTPWLGRSSRVPPSSRTM
jgi:hypothetical protein